MAGDEQRDGGMGSSGPKRSESARLLAALRRLPLKPTKDWRMLGAPASAVLKREAINIHEEEGFLSSALVMQLGGALGAERQDGSVYAERAKSMLGARLRRVPHEDRANDDICGRVFTRAITDCLYVSPFVLYP
ncbi:hypothetical protein SKAU_G00203360 [Synaphobranchus kaupii]|uniref:Uncharacterized protein n=1 Tax=Synaphobranchus kaupii TaxID=118154 RepID=A0A9Q1FG80_SYNKA|nr:hypothetical protein SKAU_G00203360 [Synaphobranchus kaupii]